MSKEPVDHYATLQVQPNASALEIERAYRRLVRANHPDLLREASAEARQAAEQRLRVVNQAYRIVGDDDRRREYDRQRRQAAPLSSTPQARHIPVATMPPITKRTTHWGEGGPIDIDWQIPPPVAPRPMPDLFGFGHLLLYGFLIILFALVLALSWRPTAQPPTALPTATSVIERSLPPTVIR